MPYLLLLWFLTLLGFACPLAAGAPMLKCRADDGTIVYQDSPGRNGIELRNFDVDPATVSVVPGWPVVTTPPVTAHRSREVQVGHRAPDQNAGSGKAAERRFIRSGMSEAEVLRRIGKPQVDGRSNRKHSKGKGKDGKHWSYLPAAGDSDTITMLTIVGGLVANVERKIVR